MHQGKWKHKVPSRALAVTSTHIPSAIPNISGRNVLYLFQWKGQQSHQAKGMEEKCKELGSDNLIYQSNFP